MRELILACAAFALQMLIFVAAGSFLIKVLKMKMDISLALILGYILYFSVFGIYMVPLTLNRVSLTVASVIWAVICVFTVLTGMLLYRKQFVDSVKLSGGIIKEHGMMLLFVLAVVAVQCLLVIFYQDTTVDAAYYVGQASTSVYTDTLQRYDPYTGEILKKFSARYVFSSYPMHNAVWSKLTGVHPIVQAKLVMGVINVLTANAIIYQLGKRLFDNDKKKADLMVFFVMLLQLFSYTIYTPGTFFFTRVYEGKAILANISLVLVFYCAIWFWQNTDEKQMWWVMLFVNISAVTFSGSSIIMPAAVSAAVLPVIFMRKRYKMLINYGIVLLPSVLYAVAYIGARLGFWVFYAS